MYEVYDCVVWLEDLVLFVYLNSCISGLPVTCQKRSHSCPLTSSSLNAARLFSPCTFASRANWSRPCRDFHRVEDEDPLRVCSSRRGLGGSVRSMHSGADKEQQQVGLMLRPSSMLLVSCWKIRRESIKCSMRSKLVESCGSDAVRGVAGDPAQPQHLSTMNSREGVCNGWMDRFAYSVVV